MKIFIINGRGEAGKDSFVNFFAEIAGKDYVFNIYDKLVEIVGGGAMVPITSFGHQLIHGGLQRTTAVGPIGMIMGMFDLTASGLSAAIIISFYLSIFFKPKN